MHRLRALRASVRTRRGRRLPPRQPRSARAARTGALLAAAGYLGVKRREGRGPTTDLCSDAEKRPFRAAAANAARVPPTPRSPRAPGALSGTPEAQGTPEARAGSRQPSGCATSHRRSVPRAEIGGCASSPAGSGTPASVGNPSHTNAAAVERAEPPRASSSPEPRRHLRAPAHTYWRAASGAAGPAPPSAAAAASAASPASETAAGRGEMNETGTAQVPGQLTAGASCRRGGDGDSDSGRQECPRGGS